MVSSISPTIAYIFKVPHTFGTFGLKMRSRVPTWTNDALLSPTLWAIVLGLLLNSVMSIHNLPFCTSLDVKCVNALALYSPVCRCPCKNDLRFHAVSISIIVCRGCSIVEWTQIEPPYGAGYLDSRLAPSCVHGSRVPVRRRPIIHALFREMLVESRGVRNSLWFLRGFV